MNSEELVLQPVPIEDTWNSERESDFLQSFVSRRLGDSALLGIDLGVE